MSDFALIALTGTYHSSAGALSDAFLLARDRVEHVFAGPEAMRMETRLRILSLDGGPVAMADGRMMAVDGAFDPTADHRFIWLPAFRAVGRDALAERLGRTVALQDWLRHQAARGATIGASGAAATLPMAAGLTAGLAVPVARALQPTMRALFPRQPFEDRLALLDDGRLLIANGLAGDFELILRVMERAFSPEIARWLAAIIGFGGAEPALASTDPLAARAQLWLEQHFTGPIALTALAATLSTSQATLNRRFRRATGLSPGAYVQRLRLDSACRMLEKSDRSVDRVAQLVGYSDSRLFRTMFRRQTGMTATEWRAAARTGSSAGSTLSPSERS